MKSLVCLWSLGLVLACVLSLPAYCEDCVVLQTPEIIVIQEGDRWVYAAWQDTNPQSLTCIHEADLGTSQSPWGGHAKLISDGFYVGACDHIYRFSITYLDTAQFRWTEVNWITGARPGRIVNVTRTDFPYQLSDGITVTVSSESLFITTDSTRWTPPNPEFSGIYLGGVPSTPEVPVRFTLACVAGANVDGSGSEAATVDWTDDLGRSGSISVEAAGETYKVDRGLRVAFPAGTYVTGDTLVMEAYVPFVSGDQFSIQVMTFEGYQVLRRSVEDRPSSYKVVANIARCQNPGFFLPVDGVREGAELGVLNGFPYYYAIVTYDRLTDPSHPDQLVTSEPDPIKVYPTPLPLIQEPENPDSLILGTFSVDNVYVVPNPYVFRAGWEETFNGVREAKIQFMNVPQGATIRIYDMVGSYIKTISAVDLHPYDGSAQSYRAEWDLKNQDGRDITSGVYIFRVEAGGQERLGRFIVVR